MTSFADKNTLELAKETLPYGYIIKPFKDKDIPTAIEMAMFRYDAEQGTRFPDLDRINQKAYCALSPRADEDLFIEFCEDFEYSPIVFTAYQTVNGKRLPIYHTNVMMCLAEKFAVICLDCIDDKKERKQVVKSLKEDGKEIIAITGPIEGFVYCVGARSRRPLRMLTPEIMHQILNINFVAFVEFVRAITKKGRYKNELSIVGVSSISSSAVFIVSER